MSGLGEFVAAIAEAAVDTFPAGGGMWRGAAFWFGVTAALSIGALFAFVR